jgi:hypothetical protein
MQRGDRSSVTGCKRDEVDWLVDVNQIKSVRTILDHSPDCRGAVSPSPDGLVLWRAGHYKVCVQASIAQESPDFGAE